MFSRLTRGYNAFSAFMGFGQLRAMGRVAGGMRPGYTRRGGFTAGNIPTLGRELGRLGRRWLGGGGLGGRPFYDRTFGMRGRGVTGRQIAGAGRAGIAGIGGMGAADFLNPWGMGWGD